ncbi:hypothetical protein PFISCL1PPCAC_25571, partial [Pristionchus fissidentatus]
EEKEKGEEKSTRALLKRVTEQNIEINKFIGFTSRAAIATLMTALARVNSMHRRIRARLRKMDKENREKQEEELIKKKQINDKKEEEEKMMMEEERRRKEWVRKLLEIQRSKMDKQAKKKEEEEK